jgi:hypothetical protein
MKPASPKPKSDASPSPKGQSPLVLSARLSALFRPSGFGLGSSLLSWRLWVALVALATAVFKAGADYLPALGPAPLRWRTMAPRPEVLKHLPPLSTGEEQPATLFGESGAALLAPGDFIGPRLSGDNPKSAVAPGSSQDVLGQLQGVLPDILASLFYSPASTNRLPTAIMPLHFVPPPMPAPRSSTATYSTERP